MSTVYETIEDWRAEAIRRFGERHDDWAFECPICFHVAKVGDFRQYKDRGATRESATCECIGRYRPERKLAFGASSVAGNGPCDYAGYGLFKMSPVRIVVGDGGTNKEIHCFAFAPIDK